MSEGTAMEETATVEETIRYQQGEIDRLIAEKQELIKKIGVLEGYGHGTYDVALVVYTRVEDAQNYGDAASIANAALWQLIRNHGDQMPETGTLALYAKHGSKTFGPVKIAKVAEINTSSYDTGIIRRPGTAAYRFWDRTPEEIEEQNREAMGG
jgi:hypothetical protein